MKATINRKLLEETQQLRFYTDGWDTVEARAAIIRLHDIYSQILTSLTDEKQKKTDFGWEAGDFMVDEECITTPEEEHYSWDELDIDNVIEIDSWEKCKKAFENSGYTGGGVAAYMDSRQNHDPMDDDLNRIR